MHAERSWDRFIDAAPAVAAAAERWLHKAGHAYLATVDEACHPRIVPVSPTVVDGDLVLTIIPRTPKASDLNQRSVCALHLPLTRKGTELALSGRAVCPTSERERMLRTALLGDGRWHVADDDLVFTLALHEVRRVENTRGEDGSLHAERTIWRV